MQIAYFPAFLIALLLFACTSKKGRLLGEKARIELEIKKQDLKLEELTKRIPFELKFTKNSRDRNFDHSNQMLQVVYIRDSLKKEKDLVELKIRDLEGDSIARKTLEERFLPSKLLRDSLESEIKNTGREHTRALAIVYAIKTHPPKDNIRLYNLWKDSASKLQVELHSLIKYRDSIYKLLPPLQYH